MQQYITSSVIVVDETTHELRATIMEHGQFRDRYKKGQGYLISTENGEIIIRYNPKEITQEHARKLLHKGIGGL